MWCTPSIPSRARFASSRSARSRTVSPCGRSRAATRWATRASSAEAMNAPASTSDPVAVIQRQLEAYNAKDVDAWLATYAPDAEQFVLHGERLAQGHEEMRQRILTRFAEPDLHARLVARTVMGSVVVDLEEITRNF